MLPCNTSGHTAYQDFVLSEIFTHYPDPFSLSKDTWEIIIEFWHLDLSLTDSLMMERYSKQGPEPRLPSCMLRSYLLSIKCKITSFTRWIAPLKENPLYALLVASPLVMFPVLVPFMIFSPVYGTLILITFPLRKGTQSQKPKKEKRKGIKLLLIRNLFHPDCFRFFIGIP